ncbi:hypothetical protein KJ969_01670 [Patescibacteria group bacterium]|nr:hypothetical protein [Patescibacteria group bacterium]MBU1922117.1 hypothetical protein [Patescibacteria group bacterium]
MKNTKLLIVILIIVPIASLLSAVFLAWNYWVQVSSLRSALRSEQPLEITPVLSEDALFQAIKLLPGDTDSLEVQRVDDNLFILQRRTKFEEYSATFETWRVDLAEGTSELLKTRTLSPYAGTWTEIESPLGSEFSILTGVGWEGPEFKVKDFYDSWGRLLFSAEWHGGQKIKIIKDDDSIEISLSALAQCEEYGTGLEREMEATGLMAGGEEIKFSQPQKVVCTPNEMMDQGMLSDLGMIYYYSGDKLGFDLPSSFSDYSSVIVDPENLSPAGVTIK